MVEIAPFKGVMYNSKEIASYGGDLVAPPYDVLSDKEQKDYLDKNIHNILHLDYGQSNPSDVHKYDWHQRSAELLTEWLQDGTLNRLDKPTIFHVKTTCRDLQKDDYIVRNGFICVMKLEEFSPTSQVLPHEKTFSSHKEERLDLMKATGAQFSQIFGFFPDENRDVFSHMAEVVNSNDPILDFKDSRGFEHKMWLEQDEASLDILTKMMQNRRVYIADGHHRYETALNYSKLVKQKGTGPIECEYVMIYLCPMSDPGLVILPTHRLLNQCSLSNEEIISRLSNYFKISQKNYTQETEADVRNKFLTKLKKQKQSMGLSLAGDKTYYLLTLLDTAVEKTGLLSEPQELAALDTVILSEVAFKAALNLTEKDLDNPEIISYVSGLEQALKMVSDGETKGAFILNPTTVEDILKVTSKGLVMPRKSTFFYPKVTTGLVLNLME